MRAHLSRRYRVSASHRLHVEALTPAENRIVYGKCNNPHGHGHNYGIEVTVGGPIDEVTGMVCNLADLDGCVQKEVVERFDMTNLNLDESFAGRAPTTENFCKAVYDLLTQCFPQYRLGGVSLERVRIEETANNSFEYAGEDAGKGKHGSIGNR